MARYYIEPRTRKCLRRYGFLSFWRNLSIKYGRQLLDAATKTGLNAFKAVTKKVACKAVKATGEFLGNKIDDKIVKPKPMPDENSRSVEELIIPPEQREEILNGLRQVYKMRHYKISRLFNCFEVCDKIMN